MHCVSTKVRRKGWTGAPSLRTSTYIPLGGEAFGVELDGGVGREDAGAAAGLELHTLGVRRAVRAQEELGAAARGRLHEGPPVRLSLQDRQAVEVRLDAARELVVWSIRTGSGRIGSDRIELINHGLLR